MAAPEAIEKRVAALEIRLNQMQRLLDERLPSPSSRTEKAGWQAIVGTFANDPLYEEAMRLGREWRESERSEPVQEDS